MNEQKKETEKQIRTGGIMTAPHYCDQCGKDMGPEWLLGPVCGNCCRKNHRKVVGR